MKHAIYSVCLRFVDPTLKKKNPACRNKPVCTNKPVFSFLLNLLPPKKTNHAPLLLNIKAPKRNPLFSLSEAVKKY